MTLAIVTVEKLSCRVLNPRIKRSLAQAYLEGHCVMSLSSTIYPHCLVLVQPRKMT